jgi:hypothetical protein
MNLQQKKVWLDTWEGPVDRESSDLCITVSGDMAVCHGYYRLSGTPREAVASKSSAWSGVRVPEILAPFIPEILAG